MNKNVKKHFLKKMHIESYCMLIVQCFVSRNKIPHDGVFNVFCLYNLFFRWKFSLGMFDFTLIINLCIYSASSQT